jgi:hypothetical protein
MQCLPAVDRMISCSPGGSGMQNRSPKPARAALLPGKHVGPPTGPSEKGGVTRDRVHRKSWH